jgi:ATP-dependent Zn protease
VNRFFRSALVPLVVIVLLVWVASQTLIPHSKSEKKVTLSEFTALARQGNVDNVVFTPSKHSISFTITTQGDKKATVHYPADQAVPQIIDTLEQHPNTTFDSKGTGGFSWVSAFFSLLPFIILIAFWSFLMNQVQGGGS